MEDKTCQDITFYCIRAYYNSFNTAFILNISISMLEDDSTVKTAIALLMICLRLCESLF